MDMRPPAPLLSVPPTAESTAARTRAGVAYAVAAYGLWGVFPLYFKAVSDVDLWEVVAHRIVWSLAFLSLLLAVRHAWPQVWAVLGSRRGLLTLCATTLLIAGNWVVFVWAINNRYTLHASLGYYINPRVNVLLGYIFLREGLRRLQLLSVGLAAVGVGYLTLSFGEFPTIALFLALTFGLYGLLRKTAPVDALVGLTIETALLTPFALALLTTRGLGGTLTFGHASLTTDLLLAAAGLVTALPLLWFAQAARRLRLTTIGLIQYLAPTGHFLLAVFVFRERFDPHAHLVAFGFIWTALTLYSIDAAFWTRRPAEMVPLERGAPWSAKREADANCGADGAKGERWKQFE